MPNTIQVQVSLAFQTSDGVNKSLGSVPATVSMSGSNYVEGVMSLTTVEAAIPKGSIGTPGYMIVENLDVTNNALIGVTGSEPVLLLPGDWALLRINGTPFAKSSASTVRIRYLLLEA